MQTNFTLAQLADPDTAESEKILRACVHCGFCTATCPTYVLDGNELDSPRGRIYLIKDMLEHDRPATADVVLHIDRCLSCLACMTTCPSGVHYMHLVDHARVHIENTYDRPPVERLLRSVLAWLMPYPQRFRLALLAALPAKPLAPLFDAIGLERLAAMLRLAPWRGPQRPLGPQTFPALGARQGRVALLAGCVNDVLAPQINAATIAVLTRHGIEVVLPSGVGCCGSLVHHMGRDDAALNQARANIDAWTALEGLDAIVINTSGCGTTVKDYGFMLRTDPAYAPRAARVSGLAKDVSEYLTALPLEPTQDLPRLTVAYHSACSLQHGQRVNRQPKELLTKLGFIVKDVPDGHLCCGSAGIYNILQPNFARRLRERKVGTIEGLRPDLIAAGNIGCITQIAAGTKLPAVHTVELIDWATGGDTPTRAPGELISYPTIGRSIMAKKAKAKKKPGKKKKAAPASKKKKVVKYAKKPAPKKPAKKKKKPAHKAKKSALNPQPLPPAPPPAAAKPKPKPRPKKPALQPQPLPPAPEAPAAAPHTGPSTPGTNGGNG